LGNWEKESAGVRLIANNLRTQFQGPSLIVAIY